MECYISLGANLGERERTLRLALERLHGERGISVLRVSGFYETAPWGKEDQPPFVNGAAKLGTSLPPLELLKVCQGIEADFGRVRHEHWGARTLDIDLLHIPGVTMERPELRLPHPYLTKRAFVLVPLAEIAPDLFLAGKRVREHLRDCEDAGEVRPCPGSPMDFSLRLIACVDRHGALGKEGRLLFSLPSDLAFFRQKTLGGGVIMGRRTMESLHGPLDGRTNIVLSHREGGKEGFLFCRCLEELWQRLLQFPKQKNFVIGGGEIYRQLLPYCREAWVTRVNADGKGDVFLPWPEGEFSLESRQEAVDGGYAIAWCRFLRK